MKASKLIEKVTKGSDPSKLIEFEDDFEDGSEDEGESEPDESDAFIFDERGKTSVSVDGKNIGSFAEDDEAEIALKKWAKENSFFPNVWRVSDHGNNHLVTDWNWDE